MEVANVRLVLNKLGSDVPLNDVTPGEAMLLHILHGPANGGKTFGEDFTKIEIIGTAKVQVKPAVIEPMVPAVGSPGNPGYVKEKPARKLEDAVLRDRTDAEERQRLLRKYPAQQKDGKKVVDIVWPDAFNPKLPQTFKELDWQQIGATASGIVVVDVNYATGAPVAALTK